MEAAFQLLDLPSSTAHQTSILTMRRRRRPHASTDSMTTDIYSRFQTADGFCKADRYLIFQVGATGRCSRRRPAREILTEHFGRLALRRHREGEPLECEAP